jgi:hypothetical protein
VANAPWITTENGITYLRSTVPPALVTDGLSNTFAVGEKYLDPDLYYTGTCGADNDTLYEGHDWDILRWAFLQDPPFQDTAGIDNWTAFGSAHYAGAYFMFADGSVHLIGYSIDPTVYSRLGGRNDGLPVDQSKY